MSQRPPLPPFTHEAAIEKARMAENAWNTCDPEKIALAYTEDSVWRNRADFFQGRSAIVEFLTRKWEQELEYRLIKELWAFHDNRIACVSSTSGITMNTTGSALMATNNGSLTKTA